MSIYHLSVKAISRSDGRSAVACAAYRSGEKLLDEKYEKLRTTQKTGVEFTNIYAPPNTNPELLDRQTLWNEVEKLNVAKMLYLLVSLKLHFHRN